MYVKTIEPWLQILDRKINFSLELCIQPHFHWMWRQKMQFRHAITLFVVFVCFVLLLLYAFHESLSRSFWGGTPPKWGKLTTTKERVPNIQNMRDVTDLKVISRDFSTWMDNENLRVRTQGKLKLKHWVSECLSYLEKNSHIIVMVEIIYNVYNVCNNL